MLNEVKKSYLFRDKPTKLIPLILGNNDLKIDAKKSKNFFTYDKDKYRICCIAENLDNPNKRISEVLNCVDKKTIFLMNFIF